MSGEHCTPAATTLTPGPGRLTVARIGTATECRVGSSKHSCGTDCEKDFEAGSSVRLTAVADQRSTFPAGAVAAASEPGSACSP